MREIATEGVIAEDLLLQINKIQIFERDEEGYGRVEECHQGENKPESRQIGQNNLFTFHYGSPGMSSAIEIPTASTRAVQRA